MITKSLWKGHPASLYGEGGSNLKSRLRSTLKKTDASCILVQNKEFYWVCKAEHPVKPSVYAHRRCVSREGVSLGVRATLSLYGCRQLEVFLPVAEPLAVPVTAAALPFGFHSGKGVLEGDQSRSPPLGCLCKGTGPRNRRGGHHGPMHNILRGSLF